MIVDCMIFFVSSPFGSSVRVWLFLIDSSLEALFDIKALKAEVVSSTAGVFCEMSPCLVCGYTADDQLPLHLGVPFCSWCEEKVKQLTEQGAQALLELDRIPPAFSIWDKGRREDSGEAAQKKATKAPQPAHVSEGLFLGDLDDTNDVTLLVELNVGFVLNLCPEKLTNESIYADLSARLANENIKQLTWPAYDNARFAIIDEVAKQGAMDYIAAGLRTGRNVMINCWAGVNRSTAVLVAFLALRKKVRLVDAMRQAMATRGTVLTNRSFRFQLVMAAQEAGCDLQASDPMEAIANLPRYPAVSHVAGPSSSDSQDGVRPEESEPCQWRHRRSGKYSSPAYGYLQAAQDGRTAERRLPPWALLARRVSFPCTPDSNDPRG